MKVVAGVLALLSACAYTNHAAAECSTATYQLTTVVGADVGANAAAVTGACVSPGQLRTHPDTNELMHCAGGTWTSVSGEPAGLTITVTVGSGGDYPNLTAAIKGLAQPVNGVVHRYNKITFKLLPGEHRTALPGGTIMSDGNKRAYYEWNFGLLLEGTTPPDADTHAPGFGDDDDTWIEVVGDIDTPSNVKIGAVEAYDAGWHRFSQITCGRNRRPIRFQGLHFATPPEGVNAHAISPGAGCNLQFMDMEAQGYYSFIMTEFYKPHTRSFEMQGPTVMGQRLTVWESRRFSFASTPAHFYFEDISFNMQGEEAYNPILIGASHAAATITVKGTVQAKCQYGYRAMYGGQIVLGGDHDITAHMPMYLSNGGKIFGEGATMTVRHNPTYTGENIAIYGTQGTRMRLTKLVLVGAWQLGPWFEDGNTAYIGTVDYTGATCPHKTFGVRYGSWFRTGGGCGSCYTDAAKRYNADGFTTIGTGGC